MVIRGKNNVSTKLKSDSYCFMTRGLLILGLLGSFSIMMTSKISTF